MNQPWKPLSLIGGGLVWICCGGSTAAEQTGDGGPSGSAGAGGSVTMDAAGGDAQGCPDTIPSGSCGMSTVTCDYVDAQGCPQRVTCFSQFPGQSGNWTSSVPETGGACPTPGQVCGYTEQFGDNLPTHTDLECSASGKWEVKNPCPPTLPAEGAPCTAWNASCSYGGTCTAYCTIQTGGWQQQGCGDAGG